MGRYDRPCVRPGGSSCGDGAAGCGTAVAAVALAGCWPRRAGPDAAGVQPGRAGLTIDNVTTARRPSGTVDGRGIRPRRPPSGCWSASAAVADLVRHRHRGAPVDRTGSSRPRVLRPAGSTGAPPTTSHPGGPGIPVRASRPGDVAGASAEGPRPVPSRSVGDDAARGRSASSRRSPRGLGRPSCRTLLGRSGAGVTHIQPAVQRSSNDHVGRSTAVDAAGSG